MGKRQSMIVNVLVLYCAVLFGTARDSQACLLRASRLVVSQLFKSSASKSYFYKETLFRFFFTLVVSVSRSLLLLFLLLSFRVYFGYQNSIDKK
jgi:hypothetical protein